MYCNCEKSRSSEGAVISLASLYDSRPFNLCLYPNRSPTDKPMSSAERYVTLAAGVISRAPYFADLASTCRVRVELNLLASPQSSLASQLIGTRIALISYSLLLDLCCCSALQLWPQPRPLARDSYR